MQNWDRLVMLLMGGSVLLYCCYHAWRAWRGQQRLAAVGHILLGVCALALPLALVIFRS
ncbi:MAG: hypothetical protein ACM3XM_11515 [Mycobacterium leprae]